MKKVGIVMGSDSDLPVVRKAADTLEALHIPYEMHIFSGRRMRRRLLPPMPAGTASVC